MSPSENKSKVVVIYDGYCGFCYRMVRFIETRDTKQKLRLLPRQSTEAEVLLHNQRIDPDSSESVLVLTDKTLLRHSDATMKIWQELGGVWSIISWMRVIPRPIRDWVYNIIARNRYRWFGRYDTCQWPKDKRDDVP